MKKMFIELHQAGDCPVLVNINSIQKVVEFHVFDDATLNTRIYLNNEPVDVIEDYQTVIKMICIE